MALFRHHVSFGALVAIVGCTFAYYYAYVTDFRLLCTLVFVTVCASFLPDLDSDSGLPFYFVFGLFTLIAGGFSLYIALITSPHNLRMIIGVPLAVITFVWFIIGGILKHLTHHRGMMHSIPAALIAGTLTYMSAQAFMQGDQASLLLAIGVSVGYLSHLLLDELHAGINLDGSLFRPKRSLGSALKFFSPSRMSNVLTYVTLSLLLFSATN